MYPNKDVVKYVTGNFIPVKLLTREQPEAFELFRVQWTPTLLVVDQDGIERRRFVGYLPPEDFKLQLALGLAHVDFGRQEWAEAERRFREIIDCFPNIEGTPEALYWAGVARYKVNHEWSALAETARQFKEKYSHSVWAKKASVWAG